MKNAYKELLEILEEDNSLKIKWAKISYAPPGYKIPSKNIVCTLKSKRTPQEETDFFEKLKTINYDNSYGSQELFGTVVFTNGTWLEREEYDGSEWWEFKYTPIEENYIYGEEAD